MARKKGEQTYNKDTQRRIDDLTQQKELQTNLAAGLEKLIKAQTGSADAAGKITERMLGQKDAAGKLQVILEEKQKILEGHYKLNQVQQALLLKTLENSEEQAKVNVKLKDLAEEIKDLTKEYKDELLGSLGTLGKMLKAGTTLGFAMEALKGTTAAIGDIFKTTVGLASELNQELGMSGAAAMEAGMMNFSAAAVFSKFSIAELNQATKDFATTMGTTAGLTNDLRNSMAAMTKMGVGGEDAAKMAQSMESAGGSANDMTEEISKMAQDAGVLGSVVFKDMASQQKLMVGMSEKEIKLLAQKTIAMNKQGRSLSDMRSIADNMLDIESSMKAQAKARIMLGDKLTATQMEGMQEMTAAAMDFMNTGDATKLNAALDKTNMSAEAFKELGPKGMEQYAAAIGMTSDMLSEQIQKREQAKKIEESSDLEKGLATALDYYQKTPDAIKEGTTALIGYIAQMGIMNLMQGKAAGKGIGGTIKAFFGKGGGGGSPIETEVPGSDDVAPKAQGSEGGLKSLAEGLKAMGDAKVFAGIGAVALAGPAFIIALPAIPFLLFMGKVKLKALEENFSGLAAGLNSMSTTFMGSLAMGAFGIAAIPSILSIPFLLFMGKVSLKNLATNFIQLGVGLQIMSSTFMGSLALAAFGVAALIAIPSLIFLAGIALLGAVGAAGLIALGGGLAALGGVAMSGLPFLAIALIGALGIAMIPFAYALSLVTPLVEAFGNIIIGVFAAVPPIVQAVADGFVTMMGALTPESIGGLLLLGPALVMASIGMIAFSAAMAIGGLGSFFGGGLIDDITELAMIGPQLATAGEGLASITTNLSEVSGVIETLSASLSTMGSVTTPLFAVAAALYSIAGGLVSVAGAGLLASPIIGGLIGLAEVAPALQSLGEFFGMGGDSESSDSSSNNDSNKELIAEIKGLRSDIQSQPIMITVDGKVVSEISKVQNKQTLTKGVYRK